MADRPRDEGRRPRLPDLKGLPLRLRRRRGVPQVGAAPGTIVIDAEAPPPRIRVMAWSPDRLDEHEDVPVEDLPRILSGDHTVRWVSVEGLGDEAVLRALAEQFGLHPLALEDVVNVFQRAKVEQYGDDLFVVARLPEAGEHSETRQLSLFLRPGLLLAFKEQRTALFDPVRERVRRGGQRLRNGGSGYLAYALVDTLVDAYFPVLEEHETFLDELEEQILHDPSRDVLSHIHSRRRALMKLHRTVWPHSEMVHSLLRAPEQLVPQSVHYYLRDTVDHLQRLLEMIDTDRDFAASLSDTYLSHVGHRSNEVMKVLTIIATIFIPLSFIAGLYGMNFDTAHPLNMPELSLPWGYPGALGLMLAVAAAMLLYFRRKDWL